MSFLTRKGTPGALTAADATTTGEPSKLLKLTAAARAVATDFAAGAAIFAANALTFAADAASAIGVTRATSGAGRGLTVQAGQAAIGSAAVGGILAIRAAPGETDGTHHYGAIDFFYGATVSSLSSRINWRLPNDSLVGYSYSYFAVWTFVSGFGNASMEIGNGLFRLNTINNQMTLTTTTFGVFNAAGAQYDSPFEPAALTDATGGVAAAALVDVGTTGVADIAKINANLASIAVTLAAHKAYLLECTAAFERFGLMAP